MRRKFFKWLCRKLKHEIGSILPWYLLVSKSVLFPISWFCWIAGIEKITGVKYDFVQDVLIIDGIKYSRDIFYDWSIKGIPDNKLFRIAKRKNGTIYLTVVE
jgi:hypothetical protein